ncbi:glutamate-cysteine ligase family protein [Phytomonospora endophytica]|uniref:glutamate--cysteine ligase n=1 Tax=Phytomonospora endophytica TaxID=714109 RepID=A0A841FFM9_9ACTN|nr:glutamate-cysteine ligase family protein [Phytomonospora endophytica]MBB6035076.1 glutamate--cysteine ligase [Phytomonospora endophytica]GIG64175.1 glutamate--cysteine ligase [Phytomonospora endophytica]
MPTMTFDRTLLGEPFAGTSGEHVGLEVEAGLVDPETGHSIPYEGPNGTGSIITALAGDATAAGEDASVVAEDGCPLAVDFGSGDRFSLEMGGALEYSSAVHGNVAEAVVHTGHRLRQAARVAHTKGAAILSGGFLPFTPTIDIPWVPKRRLGIMREHFLSTGEDSTLIDASMGLTLSTQVTLDYSDDDLGEKVRAITLASPIVAGMFVNSPLSHGTFDGVLSQRMRAIRHTDPDRFGVLPFAVEREPDIDDFVTWALSRPMIFREHGDSYIPAPGGTFDELLTDGFGDGSSPAMSDWNCHLDQIWPQVRVRGTLEIRICDGPFWPHIGSVPAFWAGLLYHAPSRRAAIDLLDGLTLDDLEAATGQVSRDGLKAQAGGRPVAGLCRALLGLSETGLTTRIREGSEAPGTQRLLAPLWDVVRSGRTQAERGLGRWRGEFGESPAAYVRAHRVR